MNAPAYSVQPHKGGLLIHATCVAIPSGTGTLRAVLLTGPSGAGKSDLALRLMDRGAVLIADDQTHLMRRGPDIIASAPEALAGQMEVRGVGIIRVPTAPEAPAIALIELRGAADIPRLPEPETRSLAPDFTLPAWPLDPAQPSAALKLALVLDALAQAAGAPG